MSQTWQGKSKGTRLGYRIFVSILRKAGVQPAYFLLRFVAGYYFLFSWKSSGHIWYYLRQRLGFSFLKSLRLLYRNYYQFGQTIIDRIVMMSGIPNRFTFNFDGEEHLHQMAAAGKGGLLLSAHVGNWEIAGHLLKRINTPINIVMYDGEYEKIKDYLTGVTGQRNAQVIVIKNDLAHIYQINEALEKNEFVCMHADRFVAGNKSINIPFLGAEAPFPAGPFVLSSRLQVPVSFVFALKETGTHYHFFATPPQTYYTLPKNESVQTMLGDFASAMEEKVKAYPAQWYNYYAFWTEKS